MALHQVREGQGKVSATSEACFRIIADYMKEGYTEAQALDAAIDRTAHDVVFFRKTNPRLEKLTRQRLAWLMQHKERKTK